MATPQIGLLIPGTLPEGWCAQGEQDRYQTYFKLAQVVAFTQATSAQYFNFGNSTPSADNRVYPWLRTEADGAPDRWYVYYDGIWCSLHPIPSNDDRVVLFKGAAGDIDTLDGGVAGTATTKSGPFWEIDTDFSARVPVGVGTLPLSTTVLAVGDTGGADQVTLTAAQLPAAGVVPYGSDGEETDIVTVQQSSTEGDGGSAGQDLTSSGSVGDMSNVTLKIDGGGEAHTNMPPYKAVYFIKRTARKFYTQAG